MAVKLDVLINYLFDNSKLKRNIANLNKQIINSWSPFTGYTKQGLFGSQKYTLKEYFSKANIAATQFNSILSRTKRTLEELNQKGFFSELLKYMYGGELPEYKDGSGRRRKNLSKEEINQLALQSANEQIAEIQAIEKEERQKERERSNSIYKAGADSFMAIEEERERIEREKIKEREKEGKILDRLEMKRIHEESVNDARLLEKKEKQQAEYWLTRIKYEEDLEKKQRREEEKKKKNLFNLLLMRWGKFGIAGIAIAKVLQLASKVATWTYNTSQQGLDWQRTISGGASGGSFFGSGLASYQAAGISGKSYQGFKRGLQSYIGGVKLGQGNAAPLMYLGLSALDNLDNLEMQIEKSLRSLPKDISLALSSQMGLNYEMWEAIYNGRLHRYDNLKYDSEAIKKWAEVADKLNYMLTWIQTTIFNKLADTANAIATGRVYTPADEMSFWTNPFDFVERIARIMSTRKDGVTKSINIVVNGTQELVETVKNAIIQID